MRAAMSPLPVTRSFPVSGPPCALAALVLALVGAGHPGLCAAPADALADYVQQPDASFAWKKLEQRQVEGFTVTRLECTSQTWRGNVWRHQLLVIRPTELRNPDIALLEIGGDGQVDKAFGTLRAIASQAGAIVATINKVPNQPLYGGRREDALIIDRSSRTGCARPSPACGWRGSGGSWHAFAPRAPVRLPPSG